MQYRTIIHELLQQRPQMHDQIRKSRKLLPTLELLLSPTPQLAPTASEYHETKIC